MKPYCKQDFIRIRDFLVDTYGCFQQPYNWTIERWNFSISVARIMNGIPLDVYESQIAIWEQDKKILGVVNAEGEAEREAFFQLAQEHLPESVLQEMFAFCETNVGNVANGKRTIYLRIPPDFARIQEIALLWNYRKLPNTEPNSELALDRLFLVQFPLGFSFVYGNNVSAETKGQAHSKAFGYYEETLYRERAAIAFQHLAATPDYRADLDIHVLSHDNEIAAFATMWYDEKNRIGSLEPVGTIPKYRKNGLGRACIMQLANQIRQEGGTKVNVGLDQEFYMRLGFQAKVKYTVWMKEIDCEPGVNDDKI